MNHSCNRYILKALEIANALICIAKEAKTATEDDGCRILFGVMSDCACETKKQAEREYRLRRDAKDEGIN